MWYGISMVNLISSESRGQTQFIEGSIERLQDMLIDKSVIKELGATAGRLYQLSDDIYMPNIVRGEVVIPDSYLKSDKLPIIALRPWSTIRLDPNFALFTPRRRTVGQKIINTLGPTSEKSNDWLDNYQGSLLRHALRTEETRSIRGAAASSVTRASKARIDENEFRNTRTEKIYFAPRSLVMLRRQHSLTSPAVFAHEIEHVDQCERHPISVSRGESGYHRALSVELEAYYVGSFIANAMIDRGMKITEDDKFGLQVEAARKAANGNRNGRFESTPRVIAALEQRKLLKGLVNGIKPV